jgi:hypothetical protein
MAETVFKTAGFIDASAGRHFLRRTRAPQAQFRTLRQSGKKKGTAAHSLAEVIPSCPGTPGKERARGDEAPLFVGQSPTHPRISQTRTLFAMR